MAAEAEIQRDGDALKVAFSSVERPGETGRERPGCLETRHCGDMEPGCEDVVGTFSCGGPWLSPCADFRDLKVVILRK